MAIIDKSMNSKRFLNLNFTLQSTVQHLGRLFHQCCVVRCPLRHYIYYVFVYIVYLYSQVRLRTDKYIFSISINWIFIIPSTSFVYRTFMIFDYIIYNITSPPVHTYLIRELFGPLSVSDWLGTYLYMYIYTANSV